MTKRTEIGLADYLRAVKNLKVTDFAEQQAIARLCGIAIKENTIISSSPDNPVRGRGKQISSTKQASTPPPPPPGNKPLEHLYLDFKEAQGSVSINVGTKGTKPLKNQAAEKFQSEQATTLFHPRNALAVMQEMLRHEDDGGELDIEKLLDEIKTAKVITNLPLRTERHMFRHLVLIIDDSVAMAAYKHDISSVTQILESIYRTRLTIIYAQNPNEATTDNAELTKEADQSIPSERDQDGGPNNSATRVKLLVSSFGVTSNRPGESYNDWLSFVRHQQELGHHLLGLVPGRVEGYPEDLRSHLTLFPWDRIARATLARRYLERPGDGR